jgi:hypothetical protein
MNRYCSRRRGVTEADEVAQRLAMADTEPAFIPDGAPAARDDRGPLVVLGAVSKRD